MKNPTFNILKGLAIVLVVYGHVLQRTMVVAGQDFFAHPVFKIIYTFHMPLFVFISGYLLAGSLNRRSLADALGVRCKTLFIPFVIWSTLDLVVNYVLDKINGKFTGFNFCGDLLEYLFLNPSVWFLFVLFVCSFLLLFSIKMHNQFGVSAFAVIYFCVLAIPFNEYGALYHIKWFYLFYLAGYFVNRFGAKIIFKVNNMPVAAIFLILFTILLPYWNKSDYVYVHKMNFLTANYVQEILRFVYRYFVGFLGIGIAFFFGTYLTKTKVGGILEYVGLYSLDIYLLQRYFVEGLFPRILARTHWNFDFYSPFFILVFVPFVAFVSVIICILVSRIFLRRISWLNRFLLGNRF